jgi:hypothetical protein
MRVDPTRVEWGSAGSAPTTSLTPSPAWVPAAEAALLAEVQPIGTSSRRADQGTQVVSLNPVPEVLASIARSQLVSPSRSRFELLQQWEGTVVAVGEDSFEVTLKDLTTQSNPEESAELLLEDVGEGDRQLLEPGAVFYWSVGYEDTPRGRERKSIIRFRRLPGWGKQQLMAVRNRTAELNAYFGTASSLTGTD